MPRLLDRPKSRERTLWEADYGSTVFFFSVVAAFCSCDSLCCGLGFPGHGVYSGGEAPAGHPWPSASMLPLPRRPGSPCHEEL